jgi:hypothetical protein
VAQRVDPAALLIAVLAVGIGPLTEAGQWEPLNTIIGSAALLIIVPYIFAAETRQSLLREGPRLPACVATAFICGVTAAWPIQTIFHTSPDDASYISLGIAGGIALLLWLALTRIALRRRDTSAA